MDTIDQPSSSGDHSGVQTGSPAGTNSTPVDARPSVFPVVALGASAGGLEAFEEFLRAMPPKSGMGIVLVQHLDPKHPSMLVEILQRCTAMPVREAADGMAVEPDRVYVIPPNRDLTIRQGVFGLSVPPEPHGRHLPIDGFFRALAADQGDAAIGIVLSGTGTDGTSGICAIHDVGGLCLVQEPSTAHFDGMPSSALKSGCVSQALAVKAMPALLLDHVRRLLVASVVVDGEEGGRQLALVLKRLQDGTGHDFSQYKKSTLGRRINRRMGQHGLTDLPAYSQYLDQHPDEVKALFRELLINVTGFFRDAAVFDALKGQVLPARLANRAENEEIRVWVAGCATGEEAYSIAMVLREICDELHKAWPVQIYATDIDDEAIAVARTGLYPGNSVQHLGADRLRRFFIKEEGDYRVRKEIREMVVFAVQSVVKDPPFTRLDLLTCRNVLIYFEPDLQERLIPVFHYALRPGGILCLSPSESIGSHADLFEVMDRRLNIYRARPSLASRRVVIGSRLSWTTGEPGRLAPVVVNKVRANTVIDLARRTLLQVFAPPSVLTDAQGEILFVHGDTGRFLRLAPGQPAYNVADMAADCLQLDVREALKKAAAGELTGFTHEIVRNADNEAWTVNLIVRSIVSADTDRHLVLFSFQEIEAGRGRTGARRRRSSATAEAQRVQTLEHELLMSKQSMGALLEEQQISNEELQSVNEEIQSTNEELQSTNEELETSKEELQSVNEELITVNAELQTKVEQLTQMQGDMKNLLDNISVGSIFLDRRLVIRRFTRDALAVFRLAPSDIGRPLADIRCELQDVDLLPDAQAVLDTLKPVERELRSAANNWYLVRIQPYRTIDNVVDGVVLTFNDVTERVLALAVQQARDMAEAVVDAVYEPLLVLDERLQVVTANRAYLDLFGGEAAETLGRSIYEIANRRWDVPDMHELLDGARTDEERARDRRFAQAVQGRNGAHLHVRTRRVASKAGVNGTVLLSFLVESGGPPG
ncbi:MAG: CheR family methyltransferase [Hydrogenophaga sp.]|nr:CheR family methyltransferase [Hydrogenophaga sp.]